MKARIYLALALINIYNLHSSSWHACRLVVQINSYKYGLIPEATSRDLWQSQVHPGDFNLYTLQAEDKPKMTDSRKHFGLEGLLFALSRQKAQKMLSSMLTKVYLQAWLLRAQKQWGGTCLQAATHRAYTPQSTMLYMCASLLYPDSDVLCRRDSETEKAGDLKEGDEAVPQHSAFQEASQLHARGVQKQSLWTRLREFSKLLLLILIWAAYLTLQIFKDSFYKCSRGYFIMWVINSSTSSLSLIFCRPSGSSIRTTYVAVDMLRPYSKTLSKTCMYHTSICPIWYSGQSSMHNRSDGLWNKEVAIRYNKAYPFRSWCMWHRYGAQGVFCVLATIACMVGWTKLHGRTRSDEEQPLLESSVSPATHPHHGALDWRSPRWQSCWGAA